MRIDEGILLHNSHKLRPFDYVKVYRMLENRGSFNIISIQDGIVVFIDSSQIPAKLKLFEIFIFYSLKTPMLMILLFNFVIV